MDQWATLYEVQGVKTLESDMERYNLKAMVYSNTSAGYIASFCRQNPNLIHALSITNLAVLILAMEQYSTSNAIAEAIRDVFLVSKGNECLQLRIAIDQHASLHCLLFSKIYSVDIRNDILLHIQQEAQTGVPEASKPVQIIRYIRALFSFVFETIYFVVILMTPFILFCLIRDTHP